DNFPNRFFLKRPADCQLKGAQADALVLVLRKDRNAKQWREGKQGAKVLEERAAGKIRDG
ncbi:MAG: hypothetical protein ACE5H0_14260, partial [Bacteroidota bacterium]